MEIYREILPESYLLILADHESKLGEETLVQALKRAARSGKRSIWVDCSYLHELPDSTVSLLLRYHQWLQRRNIDMVLCHLTDDVKLIFHQMPAATQLPIVPTLLDADLYCHALHPRPAFSTGNVIQA